MEFDYSRTDDQPAAYTISDLNAAARALLEDRFGNLWVEAEVSEVSRARSGHVYFTLADPDGRAEVRAVMWRGPAARYGARIKQGNGIRAHGRLTVYEVRGSYQLVVDRVEEAGAGLKAAMLAELKARLEKEGLFDPARKRALPPYPGCIGVVTSREGAAFRDIIKVASRRFPVRIVIAHATVQGESAPGEIVEALARLARVSEVEVVIVGRGGGSAEDLDAFNAEAVVRAVVGHPIPVVSAVGHEIDFTLADLAADVRAATPSEAAELVVPDAETLREEIAGYRYVLEKAVRAHLGTGRESAARKTSRLSLRDPRVRLKTQIERLARIQVALSHWPGPALAGARGDLARRVAGLDALSPLASLSRGYAVVRRLPDKLVVRRAVEAPAGTEIDVTLSEGRLLCKVEKLTVS